ncbi:MAG: hypothetical protein NTW87_10175, partial [Planctomycetota bacterium]|nr:hypothetical protein [Planctomycetota bacterium]
QKVALLRVLNAAGGPTALQALRDSAKDANAEVQDAAVRALCNWPTSDAAPDLLELAKRSEKESNKLLALRGYIRLANDAGLAADKRLAMCGEALPLVQRDDEKRQLLGALGAIPSPKALAMIAPHIENPAVREEACNAAVAVAGRLMQSAPDARQAAAGVADAMEKVKQNTKNKKLLDAAGKLLEQAKK